MNKTIVEINAYNHGSTGNIMLQIAAKARENGYCVYTCCPKSRSNIKRKDISNQIFIGNRFSRNLHLLLGYFTGYNECFSIIATKRFLKKIDKIKPDIIHLHNLHGSYINLKILFNYIKKNDIRVIWTFHDCWPFTGKCPHFTLLNCKKWIYGCTDCPQLKEYPAIKYDSTKNIYDLKKKLFRNVNRLEIVTPSEWLACLVKQSFLKEYPVRIINNGIDLDIFKPTDSEFRKKYDISEEQFVVLFVSFGWNYSKGLDVVCEIADRLDDRYKVVVVGVDDVTEDQMPSKIISIHRTQDQYELAAIYSAADVFVNPTRQEVLGMVNIEALACGTPVITFDTGGSPECVDSDSGIVVGCNDIDAMYEAIKSVCEKKKFNHADCIKRANKFDSERKYLEYIDLYANM